MKQSNFWRAILIAKNPAYIPDGSIAESYGTLCADQPSIEFLRLAQSELPNLCEKGIGKVEIPAIQGVTFYEQSTYLNLNPEVKQMFEFYFTLNNTSYEFKIQRLTEEQILGLMREEYHGVTW